MSVASKKSSLNWKQFLLFELFWAFFFNSRIAFCCSRKCSIQLELYLKALWKSFELKMSSVSMDEIIFTQIYLNKKYQTKKVPQKFQFSVKKACKYLRMVIAAPLMEVQLLSWVYHEHRSDKEKKEAKNCKTVRS